MGQVMRRQLIENMKEWLFSPNRKPLVLRGARQVGKTWLIRALARECKKQLVELNFEKKSQLAIHFESNDPQKIIKNLESALQISIVPDETILFLDEIQAAPELIAKLRWFYEDLPALAVVATGSLLEFVLEKHTFSMPVGRITYCYLEPMGFEEFLLAKNETHFLEAMKSVSFRSPFNAPLHEKGNQLFKEFVMVGGMPEALSTWIKTNSLNALSAAHHHLIQTYQDDFAKYAGKLSVTHLEEVLQSVPEQLSCKFMYSRVASDAHHAAIKKAVSLLSKARICHKVFAVSANGIPVGAEKQEKNFKLILLDTGLVSTALDIKLHQLDTIQDLILVNRGALAEQAVGQLLRLLSPNYIDPKLYYWCREQKTSHAEIDYLIQCNTDLIPIEVKAGSEGKLRSLHQFMYEKKWKRAVRIYAGPLQNDTIQFSLPQGGKVAYELLSVPFYLVGELMRLLVR